MNSHSQQAAAAVCYLAVPARVRFPNGNSVDANRKIITRNKRQLFYVNVEDIQSHGMGFRDIYFIFEEKLEIFSSFCFFGLGDGWMCVCVCERGSADPVNGCNNCLQRSRPLKLNHWRTFFFVLFLSFLLKNGVLKAGNSILAFERSPKVHWGQKHGDLLRKQHHFYPSVHLLLSRCNGCTPTQDNRPPMLPRHHREG